jgi:hypothetical protein
VTSIPATDQDAPLYQARIRSAVAPMHCEPRIASQMVSQQLAGHLVDVVDEEGDWVRARGTDDYEGWVHRGFIVLVPPDSARQSRQSPLISLGCGTRDASDARRALPLRAILSPDEQTVDGEAVDVVALHRRFPLEGPAIAQSAREFFRGTSYLWGGVTPWGADCSGLVQTVFALHGLQLPRDAWQQAELGADVPGGMDAVVPGDLLFFSDRADRHITHVGVALGPREMVHLSLGRGGYAHDRLGATTDRYVCTLCDRFVSARRLVESMAS